MSRGRYRPESDSDTGGGVPLRARADKVTSCIGDGVAPLEEAAGVAAGGGALLLTDHGEEFRAVSCEVSQVR